MSFWSTGSSHASVVLDDTVSSLIQLSRNILESPVVHIVGDSTLDNNSKIFSHHSSSHEEIRLIVYQDPSVYTHYLTAWHIPGYSGVLRWRRYITMTDYLVYFAEIPECGVCLHCISCPYG